MSPEIFSLANIDKRLLRHLELNGGLTDEVGLKLINMFVQFALSIPVVKNAATRYAFSHQDLRVVYIAMVTSLWPNPTINAGARMLAASLPFMEPFRIEMFMGMVHQQFTIITSPQERQEIIINLAAGLAEEIWNTHTEARGESPFHIDQTGKGSSNSSGCFSVLVIGFSGFSALFYLVAHRLFT